MKQYLVIKYQVSCKRDDFNSSQSIFFISFYYGLKI